MRQYLVMQAYGPGAKSLTAGLLTKSGTGFGSYGTGSLCLNSDASAGKVVIQHFGCRSLSVGTWRRVGQSTMDLVIFYSPDKACITYYINNDNAGYKIEYPFSAIKSISLEQGDVLSAAEGASQRAGGLLIELNRPPKFYMDGSGSGFYECGDFTEDQQASQIMVHQLGGPSKVLSGQLAKLVSLESYQNRHMAFDSNPFAPSAPVSPMRPASQPNHMLHPHHHAASALQQDSSIGLMGPPAPRGHKRQRSRSVPAAIDMSMLRHPMPSFLIQQEHQSPHPIMQDPNIFAPIPQHHPFSGFTSHSAGPGLSIDTTASYNMGMHLAGPMSATTINSPSEFGTPAFFTSAPMGDGMPAAQFGTPFNNGYLAVDPTVMIGTSNTPLSATSHGDPAIADHSPPLTSLGRSQSADIFGTPGEHSHFGDDSLFLSESFNKQIQLPFRSPMSDGSFHSPMPDGSYAFQPPPNTSNPHASLPLDGQHQLGFDMPPPQTQDGSMVFQSPPAYAAQQQQQHQDSGVSFSTPSHLTPHDITTVFNSPKDSSMLYHDSKCYSSPIQMHPLSDEHALYQHSPLAVTSTSAGGSDPELHNLGIYGTIDPNNLGQQHQQ